ncbi:glycoside hydrolase family 2 protein [Mucilaginibacter sp. SG564]|uniref:glycoside hydrolase family 2 protein n=1 Tax=Mucilaginibacter sp. SG564 TaxID=2587022 RepID=UPI001555AA7E|nr:glycoside hydrolase family 2 TIM barrel-domain containing protein [Mucilaginibacter sp. SG564]NOW93639.1 beta-galactosidase/beta-glucuronidase [Mucilaginibacter sp. SG564]
MNVLTKTLSTLVLLGLTTSRLYAQDNTLTENFENPGHHYQKTGRGECRISNGVLTTKDAYLSFGDANWKNYEISFRARVPDTVKHVQICAGFRAGNRDDWYILMLKGGIQQDIYLARLGYMGSDDFLALRRLDFHPEPGKWYNFRVQACGKRIRVFLNNENLPRIDIADSLAYLSPQGQVTLGGSWITNEFDDLVIKPLGEDQLKNTRIEEYSVAVKNKEVLRRQQRSTYKPISVEQMKSGRTVVSLNGQWLFSPGYEATEQTKAVDPEESDRNWHVLTVPNFWNPTRVWLHGEKYNNDSKGVADNYYQKETARCEAYTFDYKKTNVGWYRQWITLPNDIDAKNLQLSFDAVSKVAEVYINGHKSGSHIGMFGNFELDGTGLFKPGKNLVAVKVIRDYVKDIKDADKVMDVAVTVPVTQKMMKDLAHGFFGDDPAGIWQPVSLIISDPMRIQDVFIKPNLSGADMDITVKNYTDKAVPFSVAADIHGVPLKDALYNHTILDQQQLQPGEERTFTATIKGLQPRIWSPEHPDLYDFNFKLTTADGHETDSKVIRSGFRVFKAEGDYLYLNGKRYWLRGANQTPLGLAPNDTLLADTFTKLMNKGNMLVTRTHTVPGTETWMDAFDKNGIGVSYEGTWSWLFLSSSMPSQNLIDLWKQEFYDLLKKYRNHPSLWIWTVNNEMKFYDNDPDTERAKVKMKIISDVVKHMRQIDPTRPIVFDSNYHRNTKRFGDDFYKDIDDGDIDDQHAYLNWYDYSIFDYFKGEWQQKYKNSGRPLISQEMSTGYTDETGHATRFYNYVHQNPESLAGKFTYEYSDPAYFMKPQAFITKELAEALRRSDDRSAGILHFALITWFTNVYQHDHIKPFPVFYDMQKALQPVLVSAELWGRHFYAGTKLPVRFCVINDQEDGSVLPASTLQWKLMGDKDAVLASGNIAVLQVDHYSRHWIEPQIDIPDKLPQQKQNAQLQLQLIVNDKTVSVNSYEVLLAAKPSLQARKLADKKIVVFDAFSNITTVLKYLGIQYTALPTLADVLKQKADVYLLSGLDSLSTTTSDIEQIRQLVHNGRKVLLSGSGSVAHILYPEYIRSLLKEKGEITNIDIPESSIFDGIEPLEIRYLNNNQPESPSVISGAYRINRDAHVEALASFIKIHGYLSGNVNERMRALDKIKGFPIVKINDGKGAVLLSEIRLDKAITDPVAGRLLINMLLDLTR